MDDDDDDDQYDDVEDDDDGLPAHSHHDKIPMWWEYVCICTWWHIPTIAMVNALIMIVIKILGFVNV